MKIDLSNAVRKRRNYRDWDVLTLVGCGFVIVSFFMRWFSISDCLVLEVYDVNGLDMLMSNVGGTDASFTYLGLVPFVLLLIGVAAAAQTLLAPYLAGERMTHIYGVLFSLVGIAVVVLFLIKGKPESLFYADSIAYQLIDNADWLVYGKFAHFAALLGLVAVGMGNLINILEDIVLRKKEEPSAEESSE